MSRTRHSILAGAWLALLATAAHAQTRPLVTADSEPVGSGRMSVDLGVDISKDAVYPLSGLKGTLVRYGTFDLNFGVSTVADIQLSGGFLNRLSIKSQDPTAPLAGLLTNTGNE